MLTTGIGLSSAAAQTTFTATSPSGHSLTYSVNSDGQSVTITGHGTSMNGGLVIPSSVQNQGTTYSVTHIGTSVFSNCSGIVSVTIPESVKIINAFAFSSCNSLTTVYFNCTNHLDPHLRDYGQPYSLSPFANDTNITSFIFGDSVTYIPEQLCWGLTGLTSINIPSAVQYIGYNSFADCSGLTALYYNARNAFMWDDVFNGDTNITTVIFGQSVRIIPSSMCQNMKSITSVTLPDSIERIENYAFSRTNIRSLVLPTSIQFIGTGAFRGDSVSVYYNGTLSQWCNINNDGAFATYNINERDFTFFGTGYDLFIQDSLLRDLVIPNDRSSLTSHTFEGCNITSVVIPDHVTTLLNDFCFCPILESVIIGNGITTLSGFGCCESLTDVTLGSNVAEIQDEMSFSLCRNLSNITSLNPTAPILEEYVFYGVPNTIPITIPCGSTPSYLSRWSYFSNFVEMSSNTFEAYSADESMGTVEILTAPTCTAPTAVIYANANNGYRFDRWSDGNTDNPRTLTVVSDTVIIGHFASENAIEPTGGKAVTITATYGTITVSGATGECIRLFDLSGRQLAVSSSSAETQTFAVPTPGVFFVQVGNQSAQKVIIAR